MTKTDFDTQLKKISDRVTPNKPKHWLVETELRKLEKFDAACFMGKDRLEENYLVFKPMNKYFKKIGNTKGLSDEAIQTSYKKLLSCSKISIC